MGRRRTYDGVVVVVFDVGDEDVQVLLARLDEEVLATVDSGNMEKDGYEVEREAYLK